MNYKEAILTVIKVIISLLMTGLTARVTFELLALGWNLIP